MKLKQKQKNSKSPHIINKTIIKIDIDNKNIPEYTIEGISYLSHYYSIQKLIIKKSPSKKGFHIIIYLKEKLSDLEIILIQFCIGSDKYRERLNYIRYLNGGKMKDWNILFNEKLDIPIDKKFLKDYINEKIGS